MSGILFARAKKGNANTITKYTQLDVNTSAQGIPIAIGWGSFRKAPNLVWTGNFQAIPQKSGGGGKGGGGKGGGGKGSKTVTSYNYRAAVVFALCEGPIQGIHLAWRGRDAAVYGAADPGVFPDTLFLGDRGQPVWSFLASNDPANAIGFSSTAYLADSQLDLGSSPSLQNYGFEIRGKFYGTIPAQEPDALPADIINDFLTSEQYGIGFGPAVGVAGSFIHEDSWNLYKTYNLAAGIWLSPLLEAQEQVSAILDRWAQVTNTWIFWSGGLLKFVPLGDTALAGAGAIYTPNNAAIFDLGYEDFVSKIGEPPIAEKIVDPADRPNNIKFEIENRAVNYDAFPVDWSDDGLILRFGRLPGPSVDAHDIKEPNVGATVAQLIGKRAAYINRTFDFRLGWGLGCLLEPGDIVTLTEPHKGLNKFPVRIQTLDEDKDGIWAILAEEFPDGVATAHGALVPQPSTANSFSTLEPPGNVNPPAIFEPDSTYTTGHSAQLWVSASGGAQWGGAVVWLSLDGVNYSQVGTIENPARQGVLTADLPNHADPDTVDTLAIDLTESFGTLDLDATHADADAKRTLCWITDAFATAAPCNGELLAYGTAAAGPANYQYDLSYLRRGCYGSFIADHPIASYFTRIDIASSMVGTALSLVIYDLPPSYIGVELFLKFQSFNRFGQGLQDLSTVVEYTYTPCGHGFGTGTNGCPKIPTGLGASGQIGGVLLSWDANVPSDNVTEYKLFRASGHGASFGGSTLVWSGLALSHTDTGLAPDSEWTYFLEACNAVCCSAATDGVNATVSNTAQDIFTISFSVGAAFGDVAPDEWDGNYEIFDVEMPMQVIFPANFSTSPTPGCEVAPGASVTLTFQKIHLGTPTTVGTLVIANGATTGTLATSGGLAITVPVGDRLRLYADAAVDTTIAGVFGTVVGKR